MPHPRSPPSLASRVRWMAALPALAAVAIVVAVAAAVAGAWVERRFAAELERAADAAAAELQDMAATLATAAAALGNSRALGEALDAGERRWAEARLARALAALASADGRFRALELRAAGADQPLGAAFRAEPPAPIGAAGLHPDPFPNEILLRTNPGPDGGAWLIASAAVLGDARAGWLSVAARLDGHLLGLMGPRLGAELVLLANGRPAAASSGTVAEAALEAPGRSAESLSELRPRGEGAMRGAVRHLPFGGEPLDLLVLRPAAAAAGARAHALLALLGSGALVLALSLSPVGWAARRIARPLDAMSRALQALAEGRRDVPLPAPRPGETAEVARLRDALDTLRASVTEREALHEMVTWLANFDSLTKLPNRSLFLDRLATALGYAERTGGMAAVHFLDLDHLKEANDAHGHAAGDALLRGFAERVGLCLRGTDTLARLGGDEFAILQTGVGDEADAEALAARVLRALASPLALPGGAHVVPAASVGIAVASPARGYDAERLLSEADLALYAAKSGGRGAARFFDAELDAAQRRRRERAAALAGALDRGELRLVFQPQLRLADRAPVGAEALLRWRGADGREHPPAEFVPLAEATGAIRGIGAWVLREACRVAAARPGLRLSVNVSPVQLRDPGFPEALRAALALGCAPSSLELEVTESAVVDDAPAVRRSLEAIRAAGVGLALDDFGTGHSSLAMLKRFAFDRLKIDRRFVQDLETDETSAALVRATVAMARALGLATTAEGVETEAQARALRALGCDEAQGFLFDRPLEIGELDARWRGGAAAVGQPPSAPWVLT